jgi:hypothetical protein
MLVAWTARLGVATVENLTIRFALPELEVRTALACAVRASLLRCTGVLRAEPEVFVATRAGLRAVGMGSLPVCSASPRAEGHLRAVASAAVWLERKFGSVCRVISERELQRYARTHQLRGGRRLPSPYVHHAGGTHKRPDLLLRPNSPADGLPVAVEVELSAKSAAWLRAICVAWNSCPGVAGVLYLAAPCVLEPLRRAIEGANAERRIVVVPLDGSDVPTLRRREFYRPQPAAGAYGPARPRVGATAARVRVRRDRAIGREVLELVRWVGRWGVVGVDSLQLHLRVEEAQVLESVRLASRQQLIDCAVILRGEGVLCWASRRGLHEAGLPHLRTCAVNYSSAETRVTTARIAALLEREHPGHEVIGLRELEAKQSLSSQSVAALVEPYAPLRGSKQLGRHRRPAIMLTRDRDFTSPPIAALVQAAGIPDAKLRGLLHAWAELDGLRAVIFYIGLSSVRRTAARALVDLDAGDRVSIRPLPRAISRRL